MRHTDCNSCQGHAQSSTNTPIEALAISAADFKNLRSQTPELQVIDVREPSEHATQNIGGQNIPLSQLPDRFKDLNPTQTIVVYCHLGPRSIAGAKFLKQAGFEKVYYLQGGVSGFNA